MIVTIKNEDPVELVLNATCESSCFLVTKIFNKFGVFTFCNPRLYLGSSTGSVVGIRRSVPWNSGLVGSTIVPCVSPGLFLGSPSILHCLLLGISEVLPSTVGIVLSRVS